MLKSRHSAKQTTAEAGNTQETFSIQKTTPVKRGNLPLDPDTPSIKPVVPTKFEPQVKHELSQDESSSPGVKTPKPSDSCFRDLLKLQERQTELSAMIANQQRTSLLPVQEPPLVSTDYFD